MNQERNTVAQPGAGGSPETPTERGGSGSDAVSARSTAKAAPAALRYSIVARRMEAGRAAQGRGGGAGARTTRSAVAPSASSSVCGPTSAGRAATRPPST